MHEWKTAPTQIEADLLLRQVDIHDWHRGTRDEWGALKLSSRRLLVLLSWLPESSAVKRDGGYTQAEFMMAETHNEIARLRSSYHAVNGGEDAAYEPFEFIDPRIEAMRAQAEKAETEDRQESDEDFYSDMGWT